MNLIYVDGDNVSLESLESVVKYVKSCNKSFVGRIYGNQSSLRNIINYGLQSGFEIVDTSILSNNKKNLTDMKMVTDCLFDAMITYSQSKLDLTIYLLSNDCDFTPLVYKLASLGIEVITPLLVNGCAFKLDITSYFKSISFKPSKRMDILNLKLGDVFNGMKSDSLSNDFIRRRTKLITDIEKMYPDLCTDSLMSAPINKFSFSDVVGIIPHASREDIMFLANVYLRKMFGVNLSDNLLMERLTFFNAGGDVFE